MKGILMKPDMRCATREGEKTVTRRLSGLDEINLEPDKYKYLGVNSLSEYLFEYFLGDGTSTIKEGKPRYHAGETVFIGEAWATNSLWNDLPPNKIPVNAPIYFADSGFTWVGRARSPLHLRAVHARSFLTIVSARPERLQEITEEDAKKEGASLFYREITGEVITRKNYRMAFIELWDSINPEYPWESNPWLFRYEIKEAEGR